MVVLSFCLCYLNSPIQDCLVDGLQRWLPTILPMEFHSSYQKVESILLLLNLGWPHDLLWLTESKRVIMPVLGLAYKRAGSFFGSLGSQPESSARPPNHMERVHRENWDPPSKEPAPKSQIWELGRFGYSSSKWAECSHMRDSSQQQKTYRTVKNKSLSVKPLSFGVVTAKQYNWNTP